MMARRMIEQCQRRVLRDRLDDKAVEIAIEVLLVQSCAGDQKRCTLAENSANFSSESRGSVGSESRSEGGLAWFS